ncbi:putative lipoprotein [Desulfosporosinus sp. OT]|nr:putative lipoprotein [Desulfosporosinus sp. OT]
MRKMIYLLLIFCLVLATTLECNKESDSEFSKVVRQDIPKRVQNFIDTTSEKNGVYLYASNFDNDDYDYLFLNAINVNQGDRASFFTDVEFEIEEQEHTLKISFNEELADDWNYTQKIENMLIYKIKLSEKFDTIKVFKNGEAIPIDVVGV